MKKRWLTQRGKGGRGQGSREDTCFSRDGNRFVPYVINQYYN